MALQFIQTNCIKPVSAVIFMSHLISKDKHILM